jgi:hypothetical protein
MAAFLVVRSVVSDPSLRAAFDRWYATDHLPWAIAALGAQKGWRLRSESDAALHYAVYQFGDAREIERALQSEPFQELVVDYDRRWPRGVTRTREIVSLIQEAVPGG